MSYLQQTMLAQPGEMPPTMYQASMSMQGVWLEINGNKMLPGIAIRPLTRVTIVADLLPSDATSHVIFEMRNNISGAPVFGPVTVEPTGTVNPYARIETNLSPIEGTYTLLAHEVRPFFPDDDKSFPFSISVNADPPPPPITAKGSFPFVPLLIGGGILLGLVVLSPTINAIGGGAARRVFRD